MTDLEKDDQTLEQPAPDAGNDGDSDEALWKEFTGLNTDGTSDPKPSDPKPDEEDDPDAEAPASEPEGTNEDGDTDHDDPDALREQIDKLTQQVKSEKGRARGLNMKYERLQSELRAAKAERDALREADSDDATKEKLSKAREEYGDVLDPVLERMDRSDAANRRLAGVREERVNTLSRESDEFLQEQFSTFNTEHPNGVEFLKKNHEAFKAWVEDQPKADRDIYEENKVNMVDGHAAALLLSKFKAHKAAASDGGSRPASNQSNSRRRERQLAGATSVRAPSSQVITSDNIPSDDDPEALFNYYANKKTR